MKRLGYPNQGENLGMVRLISDVLEYLPKGKISFPTNIKDLGTLG